MLMNKTRELEKGDQYGLDEVCKGEYVGPIIIVLVKLKVPVDLTHIKDSKYSRKTDLLFVKNLLESGKICAHYEYILPEQLTIDVNVNDLIFKKQDALCKKLCAADTVYIDCHLKDVKALIQKHRNSQCKKIIRHKHDAYNKLVALASLVGKLRKLEIYQEIYTKTGLNPGSGNFTDALTKAYLNKSSYKVKKKWKIPL